MASVIINDDNLKNIAEAIREKGETNETYTPSEMADAIRSISGGGGTPDAVQYVPQTLTDAQKTQARTNIGAGVPVTIDANLNTSGAAADAQVVGNRFTEFTSMLDGIGSAVTVANNPKALHWDGTIGDRIWVQMDTESPMVFVRVYDDMPDLSAHLSLGLTDTIPIMIAITVPGESDSEETLPMSTTGGLFMASRNPDDGFIMAVDGYVCIVPYDNYTYGSIIFPKKGIYVYAYSMIAQGMDTSIMHVSGVAIAGNDFSSGGASKYFEKTTGTKQVGDTLTWDGEIGERASTENRPFTFGNIVLNTFREVKISDATPSFEIFPQEGITIKDNLNGVESARNVVAELSDDGAVINVGSWRIILEDGVQYDGATYPGTGTYASLQVGTSNGEPVTFYGSAITIPGYDFIVSGTSEVIKTEHLPEALRFGEIKTETRSDTLTWDGNTDGKDSLDGFYKISETVPTLAQLANGGTMSASTGEAFEFTANDVNEDSILIFIGPNVVILKNEVEEGNIIFGPGVYFVKAENGAYISSLTINGYDGFVTKDVQLVTIDPKYLPAGIGGGNVNVDGILAEAKEYTNNTVSTHNTDTNAHNDIRDLINAFTLNSFGVTATATELNYVDGVTSNIQTQLNEKASSNHTQSASTITAGTFAGQVVANSSYQSPTTSLLRNSKLVSTDTNPTINGEIYWTYE